jgi:TPR repeat protein
MSLQEAVKEAQREVVSLARSIQEEQKPAYYDEVIGRACLSEACQHSVATPSPAKTLDEEMWAQIASSGDAADFESFARIFPDSPHRAEAESKAKALREAADTEVAAAPVAPPDVSTVPATECDRLAASSYALDKVEGVAHVPYDKLLANAESAVAACREAVASRPTERRLLFQLGRALDVAGQVDEAKEWYAKAVELGEFAAMNNLANLYSRDDPPRMEEAVQLYQRAAEGGIAPAFVNLGSIYAGGSVGVEQSYEEARKWYLRAADLGEPQGMDAYANLLETGSGGPVDYAEARRWYEKAAELDFAGSMHRLGDLYENGEGVAQDNAAARRWYERAAELDFAASMYRLGDLYENGKGVAQDHAVARSWYEKAADRGDSLGMYRLGDFYEHGKGGPQDYAEARRWYQASVDQQEPRGAGSLGFLYATGVGGPKDNALAAKALLFGLNYGFTEFYERLKADAALLDPEIWRDIQTYLINDQVLSGEADGVFGPATAEALDAHLKKYWGG